MCISLDFEIQKEETISTMICWFAFLPTFSWSSMGWTPGSWSWSRKSLNLWRAFCFFGIGVVVISAAADVVAVVDSVVVVVDIVVWEGVKRLEDWPNIISETCTGKPCLATHSKPVASIWIYDRIQSSWFTLLVRQKVAVSDYWQHCKATEFHFTKLLLNAV